MLAACAGAGFRPHKHLDKDADGNEHSDLRIIGGSKVLVSCLSGLLYHCTWPHGGLQCAGGLNAGAVVGAWDRVG